MNKRICIMKKILLLTLTALSLLAFSQKETRAQMPQLQQLPIDTAVLVGRLDNGLTYYIRHNEKPADRAEFWLATNVGAIQETPDQDGLAHFLEHMCFNGTKNFPDKGILDWLQSIGASFGGNVNASTGVEETQYMLNNIPLVREGVIDTCLLIMHDYAHFVTNSTEEIDKERGVIIEERRQRRTASWRLHEKALPYLYKGSKYATCTLIGSEESLKGFDPESLRTFYSTWYHPDMQALIVVGDIDPKSVEQKIKDIFSDIPAAEDPKPKDVITIPGNEEPIVGILTDPEYSQNMVQVVWERTSAPEEINNTIPGLLQTLVYDVVSQVMGERFTDLQARPDAPFINAGLGIGNMTETMEVTLGSVVFADGKAEPAFESFMTEIERLRRYGITEAECQRAKDNILASYESAAKSADTRTNSSLVPELIRHFFDNEPVLSPQDEYDIVNQLLSQVNAGLVNQVAAQLFGEKDVVILFQGSDNAAKPTEEALTGIFGGVRDAEISAPVEETVGRDLLDADAVKGGKVKNTEAGVYGSTVWTLSNEVKVVAMQSDLEKDNISIHLRKDGGTSLVEDADMPSFEANVLSVYMQMSGLSQFSATELPKLLAGKNVSASPYFNDNNHGIQASSTRKDLETAMQLVYLYFTDPRFDQAEFDQATKFIEALLPNLDANPQVKFARRLISAAYDNPERNRMIDKDVLAAANMETIARYWKEVFFKDAAGTMVYIVGDFDMDTLKSLCEKYLGALPKGNDATVCIDRHDSYKSGLVQEVFAEDMKTPQTTVNLVYHMPCDYTMEATVEMEAIRYILRMVYTETLREDEGGTYGANVSSDLSFQPKQEASLTVSFDCRPSMGEKLRGIAKAELQKLADEGPSDEFFSRTIENMKKSIPENRSKLSYWWNCINKYYVTGMDRDAEYGATVDGLTKEKVQSAVRRLLSSGNMIEVVMNPTSETDVMD